MVTDSVANSSLVVYPARLGEADTRPDPQIVSFSVLDPALEAVGDPDTLPHPCIDLMQRPSAGDVFCNSYPTCTQIYETVRATGIPNYRGARIALRSNLRIDAWHRWEHIFDDPSLVDMLAYGFMAGFTGLPTGNLTNHASALRNPMYTSCTQGSIVYSTHNIESHTAIYTTQKCAPRQMRRAKPDNAN